MGMHCLPAIGGNEKGLEVRTAAFSFSSSLMNHIYGHVGENYQLEVYTKLSEHFNGWANFS